MGTAFTPIEGTSAPNAPMAVDMQRMQSLSTPTLTTPAAGPAGGGVANPLSSAPSPTAANRRRAPGVPPASTPISADDQGRQTGASTMAPHGPARRGRALGNSGSGVPVRRSSRLSSTVVGAADTRDMPPPSPRAPGGAPSADGSQAALWLLRQCASGYRALCMYKCHDAVLAFRALPQRQYNTGWVLNQARSLSPAPLAPLRTRIARARACAYTRASVTNLGMHLVHAHAGGPRALRDGPVRRGVACL